MRPHPWRRRRSSRPASAWCRSGGSWSSCGGRSGPRRWCAPARRPAGRRSSTPRCSSSARPHLTQAPGWVWGRDLARGIRETLLPVGKKNWRIKNFWNCGDSECGRDGHNSRSLHLPSFGLFLVSQTPVSPVVEGKKKLNSHQLLT